MECSNWTRARRVPKVRAIYETSFFVRRSFLFIFSCNFNLTFVLFFLLPFCQECTSVDKVAEVAIVAQRENFLTRLHRQSALFAQTALIPTASLDKRTVLAALSESLVRFWV